MWRTEKSERKLAFHWMKRKAVCLPARPTCSGVLVQSFKMLLWHEYEINRKCNCKSDKPGVVIEESQRRYHKAHEGDATPRHQSGNSFPVEPTGIFIYGAAQVEVLHQKHSAANDEVIADHDSRDGAKNSSVSAEPAKNKSTMVRQQLPRHHGHAGEAGDHAAHFEGDSLWPQIGEVIGWRNDVRADIHIQSCKQDSEKGDHHGNRRMEAAEKLHRVPDCGAINHNRGRRDRYADKGIERHRRRQRDRLANRLLPLIASKTCEVRNVERDRRPESDGSVERRDQEFDEL